MKMIYWYLAVLGFYVVLFFSPGKKKYPLIGRKIRKYRIPGIPFLKSGGLVYTASICRVFQDRPTKWKKGTLSEADGKKQAWE